jgi:hypothetical protein
MHRFIAFRSAIRTYLQKKFISWIELLTDEESFFT